MFLPGFIFTFYTFKLSICVQYLRKNVNSSNFNGPRIPNKPILE